MKQCLFIFLGLLFFYQCATPGRPSGGPKDETPPQLDSTRTTPNLQTNFEKQRIELTFDEWIKLDQASTQIVVSPPLTKGNLEVSLKGKTVRVEFPEEEELRADATYTINFGNAIKDLTEGNPAPNLRFVFSTGDFIDSLKVTGSIVDAITKEGVGDVLLMLYDNLADTVVRSERPFYFAKTEENGQFVIENIKSDTFKVFALEDQNNNYLFDNNERIGFSDSLIILTDSTQPNIQLRFFQELVSLRNPEVDDERYGLVKFLFKREAFDAIVEHQDIGQKLLLDPEKDTIRVWYDMPEPKNWELYLSQDTLFRDTFVIKTPSKSDEKNPLKLKLQNSKKSRKTATHNPTKAIEIPFNHPIDSLNLSLINLYEDTTKTLVQPQFALDSAKANRTLRLSYKWKEATPYQLEILPGALIDFFGLPNDSLLLNYQIAEQKDFGNLLLKVSNLDSTQHYAIQLLLKQQLINEFQMSDKQQWEKNINNLAPGGYTLKIITDSNANGRWDTGSYDEKRQPELIFSKDLPEVRANWDVDAEVELVPNG